MTALVHTDGSWKGELTDRGKILCSAVERFGAGEFSDTELVVCAWQAHPESFGLRGYVNQFPDSNRVWAKVHGATGLIGRGLLAVEGPHVFRVTPKGRKAARSV